MWNILLGVANETPEILHALEMVPISRGGHMALTA